MFTGLAKVASPSASGGISRRRQCRTLRLGPLLANIPNLQKCCSVSPGLRTHASSATQCIFVVFLLVLFWSPATFGDWPTALPGTYSATTPLQGRKYPDAWVRNALLNQKDLGRAVPLHRSAKPGLNLTTAYFSSNTNFGTDRIKNSALILQAGWRRLFIDLYYEQSKPGWQLCPVRMPTNADMTSSDHVIGNVICSHADQLFEFLSALNSWFELAEVPKRDYDVVTLIFNLHDLGAPVTAGSDADTGYGTSPNTNATYFGRASLSLRRLLTTIFSDRLYTRQNLIAGRNSASQNFKSAYNDANSPWPTIGYLLDESKPRPVIAGLGTVNLLPAQTSSNGSVIYYTSYNTTDDTTNVMFRTDELGFPGAIMLNGQAVDGTDHGIPLLSSASSVWNFCPRTLDGWTLTPSGSESDYDVLKKGTGWGIQTGQLGSTASWSWASVIDDGSKTWDWSSILEGTHCGYAPLFSVASSTLPELLAGTIWSWEIDQGQNSNRSIYACAAMHLSTGRWRPYNCNRALRVACQNDDDPNLWTMSDDYIHYKGADAGGICPSGYTFAVPRTAQENSHLQRAVFNSLMPELVSTPVITEQMFDDWLKATGAGDNVAHIWLDYNCLFTAGCWVVGKNTYCPYGDADPVTITKEIAVVSSIGGTIVLVIVAIFLNFKCRRMYRVRKSSRRKQQVKEKMRRMEYVTVPA